MSNKNKLYQLAKDQAWDQVEYQLNHLPVTSSDIADQMVDSNVALHNLLAVLTHQKQYHLVRFLLAKKLITEQALLVHASYHADVYANALIFLAEDEQWELINEMVDQGLITSAGLNSCTRIRNKYSESILLYIVRGIDDNQEVFPVSKAQLLLSNLYLKNFITPQQLAAEPTANWRGRNISAFASLVSKRQVSILITLLRRNLITERHLLQKPYPEHLSTVIAEICQQKMWEVIALCCEKNIITPAICQVAIDPAIKNNLLSYVIKNAPNKLSQRCIDYAINQINLAIASNDYENLRLWLEISRDVLPLLQMRKAIHVLLTHSDLAQKPYLNRFDFVLSLIYSCENKKVSRKEKQDYLSFFILAELGAVTNADQATEILQSVNNPCFELKAIFLGASYLAFNKDYSFINLQARLKNIYENKLADFIKRDEKASRGLLQPG